MASPGLVVLDELRLDGFVWAVLGVVPVRLAVREPFIAPWSCPGDAGEGEGLADGLPGDGDSHSEATRD